MTQERVMAQVQPRLQHCLEQRDGPGILALTTWLVHRHGHPLLQQLLSQPEWADHCLWWEEQISHPNPKAADKTSTATRSTSDPLERGQHLEPQGGLRPDGHSAHPANPTESLDQTREDVKLTPAQVSKQRLTMGRLPKPAKSAPVQEEDGEAPTMTRAASKARPRRTAAGRQHRSLRLRDWLPRSWLPHQDAA